MKKGIFISYSDLDSRKKNSFKNAIDKNTFLYPVVIADRRQPMKILAEKVVNGIIEAKFLIPILTSNSIENQWVNQEIGFAKSREIDENIRIIPIIEESLLTNNRLKGFINNQVDLSYMFKSDLNHTIENRNFRKCFVTLLSDLEHEISSGLKKIVKFKGSKILYLQKDDKLLSKFPDRYTRELFGFTDANVNEYKEDDKIKQHSSSKCNFC